MDIDFTQDLNALPDEADIVVALDRLQSLAPAVESVSLVDEALRAESDFAAMDFKTRDRYRHAIISLTGFNPEFRERIQNPDVEVISLDKQPGKDLGAYLRFWRLLRRLARQPYRQDWQDAARATDYAPP